MSEISGIVWRGTTGSTKERTGEGIWKTGSESGGSEFLR